ncbi:MAG: glutamate--cysteine ligase [bacterium]
MTTAGVRSLGVRSLGIEEEFLLLDSSGFLVPAGDDVVAAAVSADAAGSDAFEHELKNEQVELNTAPHTELDDLRAELRARRGELAAAAEQRGAYLLALASSPVPDRPTTTDDARYRSMMREFGSVGRQQLTCGMHVHVGVASRAEGVGVLDGLRAWLPLLLGLSANSPYFYGEDTGYASYRTVLWGQWPTAGPGQDFGSVAAYDSLRSDLITSGAALDDGMLYFDARLSAHYPTVEIRVADVCVRSTDSVLIAALARAMVEQAARQWHAGEVPRGPRVEIARAAQWRAARHGISGDLLLPTSGTPVPAREAFDTLLDWCEPALGDSRDFDTVRGGVAEILTRGTGADLQRRAVAGGGGLTGLVDAVRAAMAD